MSSAGTSWIISGGGTSITFPLPPTGIVDTPPIVDSSFPVEGQQSVLISEGLDIRVLSLDGFFFVDGQNKAYLDTTFCSPLLGLNRQVVQLISPTTRYNGNYLLSIKKFEEKAEGAVQRYIYSLDLLQAASYVVL